MDKAKKNTVVKQQQFAVEKILEKRSRKVKKRWVTEYLIKWEGYESSDNTWEPLKNLKDAREMIQDFEQELKEQGGQDFKKRGRRKKKKKADRSSSNKVIRKRRDSSEERWIPDEIVGCKRGENGSMEFLFKWQNSPKASFVTFNQARYAFPKKLIEFFERIIFFSQSFIDESSSDSGIQSK